MKSFLTILALCASMAICMAQTSLRASEQAVGQDALLKNRIKINLSSLVLNNYSLSYERSVSRKMSVVGGYSILPTSKIGDLAFAQHLADRYLEENNEFRNKLDEANFSNKAYTGELRYYTGKHDGLRGLYLAAYGRYTTMNFDYLDNYDPMLGEDIPLPYKGKFNGVGGGLMVGAQWLLTKRLSLDWYIIGAHYGKTSGDITVTQDFSRLSESEKRALEADIEERFTVADRKLIEATITNEGGHGKVDAPFVGFRGLGVNLGFAF